MSEPKAGAPRGKIAGYIGLAAFLVGLVLAVIAGFAARDNGAIILVLVILGIFVGLLNITAKEIGTLLLAAIALIVLGGTSFGALDDLINGLGSGLDGIVKYLASFMAPAAVISAIRALWGVARPGD